MALSVKYKYSELVVFQSTDVLKTVTLPQAVDSTKTICLVMTTNYLNDSTYGSSLGNVLVSSDLNANGQTVDLNRNYHYAQQIEVKIVIVEYLADVTVYRGTVALTGGTGFTDVLLPETWNDSKTIPLLQAFGNPLFSSDVREFPVYAEKSPDNSNYMRLFHFLISASWFCHWQVMFTTDTGTVINNTRELSSIVNGTRFMAIPSITPDKTLSTMGLYGDPAISVLSTRDFPMGSIQSNGVVFLLECGAFINTTWYTSLFTMSVAPTSNVQRQVISITTKTAIYSLSMSVEISNTVAKIVGAYDNMCTADSFQEESGDFMVRVDLIDRGDGFADNFRITRGVSSTTPTSKVSVEFASFEPAVLNSIKVLMHNLKMKKLNNQ